MTTGSRSTTAAGKKKVKRRNGVRQRECRGRGSKKQRMKAEDAMAESRVSRRTTAAGSWSRSGVMMRGGWIEAFALGGRNAGQKLEIAVSSSAWLSSVGWRRVLQPREIAGINSPGRRGVKGQREGTESPRY
jgi:hypothetical protein